MQFEAVFAKMTPTGPRNDRFYKGCGHDFVWYRGGLFSLGNTMIFGIAETLPRNIVMLMVFHAP